MPTRPPREQFYALAPRLFKALAFGEQAGSGYVRQGFTPLVRRPIRPRIVVEVDHQRIAARRGIATTSRLPPPPLPLYQDFELKGMQAPSLAQLAAMDAVRDVDLDVDELADPTVTAQDSGREFGFGELVPGCWVETRR